MDSSGKKMAVDPAPSLQFIFAAFAILTSLSKLMNLTLDAKFVMGLLQLSLGIAALTGSRLTLKSGNPHGNIFLILSVVLGFAGGLTAISGSVASLMQLRFHPWVFSVILLMGGCYMLALLPLMSKAPAYIFFEHLAVALGFLCASFGDLCSIMVLSKLAAILLLIFALLSLYQGISDMYAQYGRTLPQGKSLFDRADI